MVACLSSTCSSIVTAPQKLSLPCAEVIFKNIDDAVRVGEC
jgi:hypothetical protein